MKHLSLVINAILFIAVIVLFILHFTSKNKAADASTTVAFENDTTLMLPIAYVDVDSLLTKYNYAKEISNILMTKSENSKASVNEKQRKLVAEQQEFQRKYQNNAFLSQERAEQEFQRIQKLELELNQTASRLENELTMEQLKYNTQLADSVRLCIREYNKTANYQIIFSNSRMDNILYAKEKYDITNQVLELLNSRYIPKK
ncbi:MAG: OmpH family outer membrane protein [Dysgonomonas sp.]